MFDILLCFVILSLTVYILRLRGAEAPERKRLTDALEKANEQVRALTASYYAEIDRRTTLTAENERLSARIKEYITRPKAVVLPSAGETREATPRSAPRPDLWPSPAPQSAPTPAVRDTTPDTTSLVLGVALGMAIDRTASEAKIDTTPAPAPEPDRSPSYDSGSSGSSYDSGSSGSSYDSGSSGSSDSGGGSGSSE